MKQLTTIDFAAKEHEDFLLISAKMGDVQNLTTLISRYMPFICARAYSYNLNDDNDDLIQEGLIGFLKAVDTYDFSKQVPFKYYALYCVASKINTYLKSCGTIKNRVLYNYLPIDNLQDSWLYAQASSTSTDPSNIVIRREEVEYLNEKIKTLLSGFEQEALKLYLSGHSYKEMASTLQTTTKAVDNALQRIRRKLRTVG
ncbi:MAG: sigma-70 family RNA polymerase sigma factor [Oscillospiraceae bacterium]